MDTSQSSTPTPRSDDPECVDYDLISVRGTVDLIHRTVHRPGAPYDEWPVLVEILVDHLHQRLLDIVAERRIVEHDGRVQ